MKPCGADLLTAVRLAVQNETLRQLPDVEIVRHMWLQQFYTEIADDGNARLRLRAEADQSPGAQRIHSPYDPEARFSAKRTTEWVGYKAYLTVSCDVDGVSLITHVETSSAVTQDVEMGQTIHAALAEKDLLPSTHLIDAGFIDADLLVVAKRDLNVEIVGPVKKDVLWQANAGKGFGLSEFKVDWQTQTVICPRGQISSSWSEQRNAAHQHVIQVQFKPSIGSACPAQTNCTRSKRGVRALVLQPQVQHEALQAVRLAPETPEFRQRYAKHSGIESKIS